MQRLTLIRQKQLLLKDLDKEFKVFYSRDSRHRHHLNPCLSESQVQSFEQKHNITLPEEYRMFLLNVGNGGAGPGYGLYTLEFSSQFLPASLSEPFPHREFYDPDSDERTANWDDEDERWEEFNKTILNGSLLICGYGCGIGVRLVVSGEERNNLWCNDMGNDNGVSRLAPPYIRYECVGFLDWYEKWLDRSLEEVCSN